MDLTVPEHEQWSATGHELLHHWLDKLPDLLRQSGELPNHLRRWHQELRKLHKWLDDAPKALSPARLLELPSFESWPKEFLFEAQAWVHGRFVATFPTTALRDCRQRLDALTTKVDALSRAPIEKGAEFRIPLADELQQITSDLRRILPQWLKWSDSEPDLPLILVIDDVLGRVSAPGSDTILSEEGSEAIRQERRAFCSRFHLVDCDLADAVPDRPMAYAYFCSGQRWEAAKGFVNDATVVREAISSHSRSNGKSKWSLVLVDVWFNTGRPNVDTGRGSADKDFGLSDLLQLCNSIPLLPVVALTSDERLEVIEQVHRQGKAYLHRSSSDESDLLHHIFQAHCATSRQLRNALQLPASVVAEDPLTLRAYFEAWKAARDPLGRTVLILGETGSGKDHMAKYLHLGSPRAGGPFREKNCASLPSELADSILFGFYKGAFDGAQATTEGWFHESDGGTLFLNEFPDLPAAVRPKLLTVLDGDRADRRRIEPLGRFQQGRRLAETVNVRVICGAQPALFEEYTFRNDLLFRAKIHIELSPLRERRGDIIPLVRHYLDVRLELPGMRLDDAASEYLQKFDFPGNIRTLFLLVDKALVGKGKVNRLTGADFERAWEEIRTNPIYAVLLHPSGKAVKPHEESVSIKSASESVVSGRTPAVSSGLAAAVAKILDRSDWESFSQQEIIDLDAWLKEGKSIDVIASLVAWAFYRKKDAPSIARYLTGEKSDKKTPAQVVKRFLKLDQRISDRLREFVESDNNNAENRRLGKILDASSHEWTRRAKQKARGPARMHKQETASE